MQADDEQIENNRGEERRGDNSQEEENGSKEVEIHLDFKAAKQTSLYI